MSNQQNFSNASSRFRALVAGFLLHDPVYLENVPRNLLQDYSYLKQRLHAQITKLKEPISLLSILQP